MKDNHSYYLLCNPRTKIVERKSRKPAGASENHLISLRVDKPTWKDFRAGDVVTASSLPPDTYNKWMNAIQ